MTNNPLLEINDRPAFAHILPEHVGPALDRALADHEAVIDAIVAEENPDFDNVFMAKERADAALSRAWAPVSHLRMVADTPELRAAYLEAQPKMLAYNARQGQNALLFAQLKAVARTETGLSTTERRALDLAIRNFHLSGVALEEPARTRFAELRIERGKLATDFSNAVLDATNAWTRPLSETELDGIPPEARAMFAANAKKRGQEGWLATLHGPSVGAILTFATDRALRQEIAIASGTRASDQGPNAGQFDNGPRIAKILAMRSETADILGFADPVALSLATKMADDSGQVLTFLRDLAAKARPAAQVELETLGRFAAEELGIETLEGWDIGFASERLRLARHAIDSSEIRQYLPVEHVINGMFELIRSLYGVDFVAVDGIETWHPDVRYYALTRDGEAFAGLYGTSPASASKSLPKPATPYSSPPSLTASCAISTSSRPWRRTASSRSRFPSRASILSYRARWNRARRTRKSASPPSTRWRRRASRPMSTSRRSSPPSPIMSWRRSSNAPHRPEPPAPISCSCACRMRSRRCSAHGSMRIIPIAQAK